MKKLMLILFLISALSFAGCKKTPSEQKTAGPQVPAVQEQAPGKFNPPPQQPVPPQAGLTAAESANPKGPLTPENVCRNPKLFMGKRVSWSARIESATADKGVFTTTANGKEEADIQDLAAIMQSHQWVFVTSGGGGQGLFALLKKTNKAEALFAEVTGTVSGQTVTEVLVNSKNVKVTVPVLIEVNIRPRVK